jgi:hypothetical protein
MKSLPFLVQSPWKLGTQLKTPFITHSSSLWLPANNFVVRYKPLARTYRKHVTWLLSTLWHHCLRGSMFIAMLPRNGLHNLLFHCCVRVLFRNECFCGSTVFAGSKYATVCMLSPNSITLSVWVISWCVPLKFSPTWFSWTFLMAYSKATLKTNGNKASPCFRTFWIWNVSHNIYLYGLYYRCHLILIN